MNREGGSVGTWNEMKNVFLKKYKGYYQDEDFKEEILRLKQEQDESLEDYIDRLDYLTRRRP